jgi:hypothetical protein
MSYVVNKAQLDRETPVESNATSAKNHVAVLVSGKIH